jgi:uncharacterized protein YjbJ (UPF0337 family)
MDNTGSRSGYDSSAARAMGQSKKQSGQLINDKQMEEEGEAQEASATAKEEEMLRPFARGQAAERMKDNAEG